MITAAARATGVQCRARVRRWGGSGEWSPSLLPSPPVADAPVEAGALGAAAPAEQRPSGGAWASILAGGRVRGRGRRQQAALRTATQPRQARSCRGEVRAQAVLWSRWGRFGRGGRGRRRWGTERAARCPAPRSRSCGAAVPAPPRAEAEPACSARAQLGHWVRARRARSRSDGLLAVTRHATPAAAVAAAGRGPGRALEPAAPRLSPDERIRAGRQQGRAAAPES